MGKGTDPKRAFDTEAEFLPGAEVAASWTVQSSAAGSGIVLVSTSASVSVSCCQIWRPKDL